MLQQLIVTT